MDQDVLGSRGEVVEMDGPHDTAVFIRDPLPDDNGGLSHCHVYQGKLLPIAEKISTLNRLCYVYAT